LGLLAQSLELLQVVTAGLVGHVASAAQRLTPLYVQQ